MGEHVLVAVDGSEESLHALEHAFDLTDVDITVITVVDPFDVDPLTPGLQSPLGKAGLPAYSQEWYEKEWNNAKELHEVLRDRADNFDGEYESVVKLGNPAKQILHYAAEHAIDQIVLGAASDDRFSHVLLGSIAETVTKRANITVTVVR
ncbi:universal stress protein [Natrinema soli]|uniref:Universal stress protein n=1 Tax=Natrinema soli TaxID=1930624 RepID=A0ABD5SM51_9EURY|nr:universal stress protein [Natrinema soli]